MGVDQADPLLPHQPEEATKGAEISQIARSQVGDGNARCAKLHCEGVAADRLQAADAQLSTPREVGAGERRYEGLRTPGREGIDQPE